MTIGNCKVTMSETHLKSLLLLAATKGFNTSSEGHNKEYDNYTDKEREDTLMCVAEAI